jgi:hypothetical protein
VSVVETAEQVRPEAAAEQERSSTFLDRAPGAALGCFVVVELIGLGLYLWFGRDQWFWWDEWELLAGRSATSADGLLQPYHGHLIGTPVLAYRALWSVFGLHWYLPYQLLAIGTHLGVAALLRVVMRRAGVAPWIATAAAGAFVLFGTGKQNIMWGFQITFTGALLFGLVQLLLADHEGRIDWRDGLGLVAGILAVGCSGVGVAMLVAVGVATVLRRGLLVAMFHVGPPALLFLAWWYGYGRHDDYAIDVHRPDAMRRFVLGGMEATLHSLTQFPALSWVLLAMLIAGLVLAWRRFDKAEVRRRAAGPLGLALAAFAFLGLTAYGRATAIEILTGGLVFHGRYRHVVAALLLPAVAVAADAMARQWRVAAYVVLPLLLVGVPLNVHEITERDRLERTELGEPALFSAVVESDLLDEAPASTRPFPEGPVGENVVTVGWIRAARDAGKLPEPTAHDQLTDQSAQLRLALRQEPSSRLQNCRPMTQPEVRRLDDEASITFAPTWIGYRVQATPAKVAAPRSGAVFDLREGGTFSVIGGELDVRFAPVGNVQICD